MGVSALNPTLITALSALTKTSTDGLNSSGGGCSFGLFTNNVSPTAAMLISVSNFQTPSFTGYAPVMASSVTATAGFNSAGQNAQLVTNAVTFTAGSASNETIYGFFITNTTLPGQSIFAKTFDTPIVVTTINQLIPVIPEIAISNNIGGI